MDKQKQLNELVKIITKEYPNKFAVSHPAKAIRVATEILKHYQPKIPEGAVVLTKEEYDRLKCDAERYDPFWFCTFDGCEGLCHDCKDTCEMSILVKERKETAKEILQPFAEWLKLLLKNIKDDNVLDFDGGKLTAYREAYIFVLDALRRYGVEVE